MKEFDSIREIAKEDHWDYHHQKAPAESLVKAGYQLSEKIKEWLAEFPEHPSQEQLLPYYFDLLHFLKVSEFYDDHYETTVEKTYRDLIVKEFCIDPSLFLEQSLDKGRSSILFLRVFHPYLIIRKHWADKKSRLQTAESFSRRKPASFHRKLLRDDLSKKGTKSGTIS